MAESEAMYHIACRAGEVGRYVFLPGDPGRVPLIAEFLDEARWPAIGNIPLISSITEGERDR